MNLDAAEDEEPSTKVGALRSQGVFDEFVVWGHESVADTSADPYVRSVEEWVGFAEKVCHFVPSHPRESGNPARRDCEAYCLYDC